MGHIPFSDDDPSISIETQRTRGQEGCDDDHDHKSRNPKRPLAIPAWFGDMLFENRSDLGGVSDGDYVFVSHKSTPLHCGNWRKRFWLPAVKKAGLRICTFTTCVMSLPLASMKRELATKIKNAAWEQPRLS